MASFYTQPSRSKFVEKDKRAKECLTMIIRLHSTASGTPIHNSTAVSWEHTGILGGGTDVLLAFVGAIDADRPNVASAVYAGTPFQLLSEIKGPGGDSFPSGHIFALANPSPSSGIITVVFDDYVGVLNGFSVAVSGLDTAATGIGRGNFAINPQLPNFEISNDYIVAQSGILFDLCVAQSSKHTLHNVGSDQVKIADLPMFGAKFSVSYRLVNSGTEVVTMSRNDCGGPFAGVSLSTAQLKGL